VWEINQTITTKGRYSMSQLIDERISIFEALQNIRDGKYVMPAFQRQ
jgi:hypothetical protein